MAGAMGGYTTPLCFIYIFTAFPLFAYIGGGRHGIKTMFQHIARPAIMSLGTCSSSATIPTNLREAEDTGIPKDVADMVVPMGATMHMDGSCFSCVLKSPLSWGPWAWICPGPCSGGGGCGGALLGGHVRRARRRLHR